ncbi:MAG: hypothetical protein J6I76_00280 [Oribacterium sp.]|nr:hypothetical protein [Oribacterium sp.]
MSLVNDGNGNMVMPVSPMGGGYGSMGWGGDGSFWIIILFLFAMFGGWGNGFGAGNGGGMMPYMMNNTTNSDVQRGFDQQAVMGGINGIQASVNGLVPQLCNGFSGITNGFAQAEIAANNRQMANMNQMNTIAMNQQAALCDNRANIADLKYTVATEGCNDRQAVTNALFDVTTAQNANTQQVVNSINNGIQSIHDKLCSLELEGVKGQLAQAQRENSGLQSQLAVANQNAIIKQGFASEVDALYNRLNNCPVPTTPVYGRTPIFTCGNQGNAGCGCGNF